MLSHTVHSSFFGKSGAPYTFWGPQTQSSTEGGGEEMEGTELETDFPLLSPSFSS